MAQACAEPGGRVNSSRVPGLKEAEILGDTTHVAWLNAFRARLVKGINRLCDPAKSAYPEPHPR